MFITLCRNCVGLKDIREYLEASKTLHQADKNTWQELARLIKEGGERKPKKLFRDIIKNDITGTFRGIMTNWILMARSNLLHQAKADTQEEVSKHRKEIDQDHDVSSELN